MIKQLKYLDGLGHLCDEAMKIHQEKWSTFDIHELNFTIEFDDITGIQQRIVSVSADVSSELSELLKIG
tara:strand:- start:334 stop:540 length:207 start_codon:yes stop_codon:yes gene_type:complete